MGYPQAVLTAIERLDYRVTAGDVAATAGLPLAETQQGMLALATEVGAHLQVSDGGEVAYVFPRNLQGILLSRSWQRRLRAWGNTLASGLFYLVRLSFGVMLILSLVLITLAILILVVVAQQSNQRDDDRRGGGMVVFPRFWFGPDIFWIFSPNPRPPRARSQGRDSDLNFLEAIFSFLFGDGNPNADLEERRWQSIAAVIRTQRGVVVAEQVAPFLDDLGQGWSAENEDYMVPVLSRFNGVPQVSPQGGLVYHFPELQVTAAQRSTRSSETWLDEQPWRFSRASSTQILWAAGLGGANLIGALALGSLLRDPMLVAQAGDFVGFVAAIYGLLLAYGVAFLAVPLGRYFWLQRQNRHIDARNTRRQDRLVALRQPSDTTQEKLAYAQDFASQTVVTADNLAYTTERDLIEQEVENADNIDAEWRRMLRDSQASND